MRLIILITLIMIMNTTFTLMYDTLPIGKRNETHEIPIELADLLDETYLFFTIAQNENNNFEINLDKYIFVPYDDNNCIDYKVIEKDSNYMDNINIKNGIKEILSILNNNTN